MPRILGIDPSGKGGHTGIVLLDVPENAPPSIDSTWAVSGDIEGFNRWARDFQTFWMIPDVVVVEHFVDWGVQGVDITPCFIEGAVRYIWPGTVLSPASGKNTAVPDVVMERLGFSKKDFKGDHHSDRWEALRHAIRYLKNQRHMPTLRKGWNG